MEVLEILNLSGERLETYEKLAALPAMNTTIYNDLFIFDNMKAETFHEIYITLMVNDIFSYVGFTPEELKKFFKAYEKLRKNPRAMEEFYVRSVREYSDFSVKPVREFNFKSLNKAANKCSTLDIFTREERRCFAHIAQALKAARSATDDDEFSYASFNLPYFKNVKEVNRERIFKAGNFFQWRRTVIRELDDAITKAEVALLGKSTYNAYVKSFECRLLSRCKEEVQKTRRYEFSSEENFDNFCEIMLNHRENLTPMLVLQFCLLQDEYNAEWACSML